MSHLSVSDDDSSFERIDSSGASSPLNSSMDLMDSDDCSKKDQDLVDKKVEEPALAPTSEGAVESQNLTAPAPILVTEALKEDQKTPETLEDPLINQKDLGAQEPAEVNSFTEKLNGIWISLDGPATGCLFKFEVLPNPNRIDVQYYREDGMFTHQKSFNLVPKHAALENRIGRVDYIDEDQWVSLRHGEKSVVKKFNDGTLELKMFDIGEYPLVWRLGKVEQFTFVGKNLVVAESEKDLETLQIEEKMQKLCIMFLETQERLEVTNFIKKLHGVWKIISGINVGGFYNFKVLNYNLIEVNCYCTDGTSLGQESFNLTPKHVALQTHKGSVEYIDKDQWVTVIDGKKIMVRGFKDGYLTMRFFNGNGEEEPHAMKFEKVDKFTYEGENLVVSESEKDQETLQEEEQKDELLQLKNMQEVSDDQKIHQKEIEAQGTTNFTNKINGVWKFVSGNDIGCFVSFETQSSDRIDVQYHLADGSFLYQKLVHLTTKHAARQKNFGHVDYIDEDQWVTLCDGEKSRMIEFEDAKLKRWCYYKEDSPVVARLEKVDQVTYSGKDLVVSETNKDQETLQEEEQEEEKENLQLDQKIHQKKIEDKKTQEVTNFIKKFHGVWKIISGNNVGCFFNYKVLNSSRIDIDFYRTDGTLRTQQSINLVPKHAALENRIGRVDYIDEDQWVTVMDGEKAVVKDFEDGYLRSLRFNGKEESHVTLFEQVEMQVVLDAKEQENQKVRQEALEAQERLEVANFTNKINGVWEILPGSNCGGFYNFKVLNSNCIEMSCYRTDGMLLCQHPINLTPKHAALQNHNGRVYYIDKDQWVFLRDGEKTAVKDFKDGYLRSFDFNGKEDPDVLRMKKVERFTFLGKNLVVSEDQKDQKDTLENKNSKMQQKIEELEAKVSAKTSQLREDEAVIRNLEVRMRLMEAAFQSKKELEDKDQRNQKDQKTSEPLPILQEINGIWKMVSEEPVEPRNKIGEFLKIEADSEQIKMESFKPNGVSYKVTQIQLHANNVPFKTPKRFDYIENNQWKTINNHGFFNCVRSIQDGKLVYEFFNEEGKTYKDVYERVEEIPIPVVDYQKEIEELKEEIKTLKADRSVKTQNEQTHKPVLILKELTGSWKLIQIGDKDVSKSEETVLKIKAHSDRIEMTKYKKDNNYSQTVWIGTKDSPFKNYSYRRDYIEGNEWITLHEDDVTFKSVKTIKDNRLFVKTTSSTEESTTVYERTYHYSDNFECNLFLIITFFFGAIIAALIFVIITKLGS